jgi:hypothetical protein
MSISVYLDIYFYIYIALSKYRCCRFNRKRKTEAQAVFLNSFTICSPCKWKFVVCLFVYKETNGSYLIANGLTVLNGLNVPNGLNGLDGLAHLWVYARGRT